MKKMKYIFYCLKHLDYKNMFRTAKKVSKKSKKPFIIIFFDMIFCGFKYGAGYYDYQEFEFYLLNKKERKTYLTRAKNNAIISKYNDKNYFYILDDKITFNKKFKKYIKRNYLCIDGKNFKTFLEFFKNQNTIIAKLPNGEGGKGIEKFYYQNENEAKKVYNDLIKKNEILIEECIKQNEQINKLYPNSVNTLRIFTFWNGTQAFAINSVFKLGNGGITDNFSENGMYCFPDDNGKIIVPAFDRNDNIYEFHPITKEKIMDYTIPFFKEACELVCEAAKEIKEVRYIGWDVAISENGPVLIEGNSFPGVFQIKPSSIKNKGLIPKYQKYMDIK